MIRTHCSHKIDGKRCNRQFRSRVRHNYCRLCYHILNGRSRPIASRNKKEKVVKYKPVVVETKTIRKKK